MTERDFPALCPLGHRIIPSTGECYGMRALRRERCDFTGSLVENQRFEYVTGDCATVAAACGETAA